MGHELRFGRDNQSAELSRRITFIQAKIKLSGICLSLLETLTLTKTLFARCSMLDEETECVGERVLMMCIE